MKSYQEMLLANKVWAQELTEQNPDFFRRQAAGQQPDVLWIGCSDSRVSPEQITQTMPGELFIHRNIANLVHGDDKNLMSVLQYAVNVLKVGHIVLCGHHGCGGIRAALQGGTSGPIGAWLQNAAAVHDAHRDEIDSLADEEQRVNRLVEVNVRDQLIALARTGIVQAAFAAGQPLALHGWVYDIRDGILKPLMEIDASTDLDAVERPKPVLV